MSFFVIDTEGKDNLKEIAIVNASGQVIYHGFNKAAHPHHPESQSLLDIITTTQQIIAGHLLVFHYAHHDQEVLTHAFKQVSKPWPAHEIICTWELSKKIYPNYESYSLEYLSKVLSLKVENRYFNEEFAHDAAYDAQYTYQLFLNLQHQIKQRLKKGDKPNPFLSSRVDNPFQNFDDHESLYQAEFNYLCKLLIDIETDPEHQTLGCVLIGEPGYGKTHLIMRLARKRLSTNRLFFIRCPNHADSIFFHIYSRTLESLIKQVNGEYTQLEYLVAKSVINILITQLKKKGKNLSKSEEEVLNLLTQNPFNLFQKLGSEATQVYHKKWDIIDKNLLGWWQEKYGNEGHKVSILKGITKFCRYRDPQKRNSVMQWLAGNELETDVLDSIGLQNWSENLSREEFSLEAMTVFGRLSLQDKPMIIVFDQLESLVFYPDILHIYGEKIKELCTHVPNSLLINSLFPDRWTHFQEVYDPSIIDRISQYKIELNPPSHEQIKQILQQRLAPYGLQLECLFSEDDLSDTLDNPSLRSIINRSAEYYRHHIDDGLLPPKVHVFKTQESILQTISRLESEITHIKSVLVANNLTLKSPAFSPQRQESIPAFPSSSRSQHGAFIEQYLKEKEELIVAEWQSVKIVSDTDDIGKLKTIGTALKSLYPINMSVVRFGKRKMPENILFNNSKQVVAFCSATGTSYTFRLKNFNHCVLGKPDCMFTLLHYDNLPGTTGKVASENLQALQNAPNGEYRHFTFKDRIFLELFHALVMDIINRDLEIEMESAIVCFLNLNPHWLMTKMVGSR